MGGKYSNVLTMLLVILIVAILGVVGYFGYDILNAKAINSNANSTNEEFEEAIKEIKKDTSSMKSKDNEDNENTVTNNSDILGRLNEITPEKETTTTEKEAEKVYMEGYEVKGIIEIPKTGIKYPVLETVTKKSLETAVSIAYGPGLNEVGNTIIYGHNYRKTGLFFSDNKKLSKGDEVYITDQKGEKVIYVIYNIYETTPNDATYMTRDTAGRREISLQTCTDDSSGRIIIWAAEKGSM